MSVITRFAPSPTGTLHIGSARTALFNYLFAKHHGGKFLLRIEDTDRERSTQAAVDALLAGLKWMGINWDGEAIFQFPRAPRHAEVAKQMVAEGKAFRCYTTQAELEDFRKKNPDAKFRSPWREGGNPPADAPYVIRLKAPTDNRLITVIDRVLGDTSVNSNELDDMVLLRSDGTPTYMLAVVVDDHDMDITHVIRGSDHFTNTFRQCLIYDAMEWKRPEFAHIPLIHGPDGAKLSKRHGALGVEEYAKMGYLPEAVRNYLLRLGWSHGDDEIISDADAVKWFDLDAVGKSPARFDFAKLESVNAHYIREASDERLVEMVVHSAPWTVGRETSSTVHGPLSTQALQRLLKGMPGLKSRAKTLNELAENAAFYFVRPAMDDKAKALLENGGYAILKALLPRLEAIAESAWNQGELEKAVREYADSAGQKLGNVAQPIRAALSGRTTSPPVFEVMEVLGKEETLKRMTS